MPKIRGDHPLERRRVLSYMLLGYAILDFMILASNLLNLCNPCRLRLFEVRRLVQNLSFLNICRKNVKCWLFLDIKLRRLFETLMCIKQTFSLHRL